MEKTSLLKNFLKIKTVNFEPEKEFYASPKRYNSPDPKDIPLPNFDETNFVDQKIEK